jgi:hypothetical protein
LLWVAGLIEIAGVAPPDDTIGAVPLTLATPATPKKGIICHPPLADPVNTILKDDPSTLHAMSWDWPSIWLPLRAKVKLFVSKVWA